MSKTVLLNNKGKRQVQTGVIMHFKDWYILRSEKNPCNVKCNRTGNSNIQTPSESYRGCKQAAKGGQWELRRGRKEHIKRKGKGKQKLFFPVSYLVTLVAKSLVVVNFKGI